MLFRQVIRVCIACLGVLGWLGGEACAQTGGVSRPNEGRSGSIRLLIQESALAGSQYHDLDTQWEHIALGAELVLRREPDNRYDPRAIRVEWQGHLLGYIPRKENRVVSAAMDAGDILLARVVAIQAHRNPWLRVRFAVYSVL